MTNTTTAIIIPPTTGLTSPFMHTSTAIVGNALDIEETGRPHRLWAGNRLIASAGILINTSVFYGTNPCVPPQVTSMPSWYGRTSQ